MPQQKKTETAYAELPTLSDRQYRYVEARLAGKNRQEALKAATNVENWNQNSIYRAAFRLEHHPKVQEWLATIRSSCVEQGLYTLEAHMQELDTLAREAKEAGNYGAAATLVQAKGKAAGLYIDRVEHIHSSKDANTLLDMVERLLGLEARNKAAIELGLESKGRVIEHQPDENPTEAAQPSNDEDAAEYPQD